MRKFLSIISKTLIMILLIVVIVVVAIIKNNTGASEAMTRTVARGYGQVTSWLSGLIPFVSLTELLFVILFITAVLLVIFAIKNFLKGHFLKAINKLIDIPLIVLIVIATYSFSCEASYNRQKMPLPYYETEVSRDDYVDIYNYYADDVNNCIEQLTFKDNGDVKGMKLEKLTKEVKEAYKIIENDSYFHKHFGSVKPMLSSFIYREFQITGVTFSPLGEANINTLNTNVNLPLTVAHEIAHTKGVMREDDANQLAFYVCLNSNSPYLRYSAYTSYFYQMQYMASGTYLTEAEMQDKHQVDGALSKTINYVYEFWKKHNLLADIGDFINNLYIKSSGVEEGTSSYSGGTEYEYDPTTNKLVPSLYQKLFFEKYYR